MENTERGLSTAARLRIANERILKHINRLSNHNPRRMNLYLVYEMYEQDFDNICNQMEEIDERRNKK